MSYDTGLQAIVADTPLNLHAPVGSGSVQLAAVTIQNLSPLTIAVTVGPNTHTLPAYTADQYQLPATGVPVRLIGTNSSGLDLTGLTSNVDAIWFGPEEVAASGTFPTPLNPDPLALGIAIAEILIQEGIPIVITSTTVATNVALANNATSAFIDTSQFQSLNFKTNSAGVTRFLLTQYAQDQATVVDSQIYYSDIAQGMTAGWVVSGVWLTVTNLGSGGSRNYSISGSNRPSTSRWDVVSNDAEGDVWTLPTATSLPLAPGIVMSQAVPGMGYNVVQLQGLVYCAVQASVTSPATVQVYAVSDTDTYPLVNVSAAGGYRGYTQPAYLPAASYQIWLASAGAVSPLISAASVSLISA